MAFNFFTQRKDDGGIAVVTTDLRKHKRFRSQFLTEERDIIVYVPNGYDTDLERRYPVLYLHDGQNLFDPQTAYIPGQDWKADETAEALIEEGVIEPMIIVGIYNTGEHRTEEYTPTPDPTHGGGNADLYGRMLVEEIKPFIDGKYRTLTDASNTGLGGSSLGGLVSLYLGLVYPEVFGKLAVISPSVWWDNKKILELVKDSVPKPRLKIWLDIGTNEGEEAVSGAEELRDALLAAGWQQGSDLCFSEIEGGVHSESAWAERLGDVLRYLFPPLAG
jgi:predicted alpha/beta superfamily hydrolase